MFVGAEVNALARLATSMRTGASALDQVTALIGAVRVASIWPGQRGAATAVELQRTAAECGGLGARCRELADELDRQAEQQQRAGEEGFPPSGVSVAPPIAASVPLPVAASAVPPVAASVAASVAPSVASRFPAQPPSWHDRGPVASLQRNPPISELIVASLRESPPSHRHRSEVLTGLLQGRWAGTSPVDEHVVLFDPQGRGLVAVTHGPLAAAGRVAIYVPGTGADLARAARHLDRGLALADATRRISPDTVVITWIGYRSPEVIVPFSTRGVTPWSDAAISSIRAAEGVPALAAFVDRLGLGDDVEVSLIGHSYGSLIVAGAAHRLGGVDDLVLVGSPGVGVDRASDLDAGAVYSLAAANDAIASIPVFGETPDSMAFGAIRVDVGETGGDSGSDSGSDSHSGTGSGSALGAVIGGHGQYFAPGSRSLEQLALIAAGHGGAVERAPVDWSDWVANAASRSLGPGVVGAPALMLPDPLAALRSHLSPGSRLASVIEGLSASRAAVGGALEWATERVLEEMVEQVAE